jgi:hypothetical protein
MLFPRKLKVPKKLKDFGRMSVLTGNPGVAVAYSQ